MNRIRRSTRPGIRPGTSRVLAAAFSAAAVALASVAAMPVASQAVKARPVLYYVSLGDSYATGTQPPVGATTNGYADQTVTLAHHQGYHFTLVNFGCGGATTTSILQQVGCSSPAIDGAPYNGLTQAAAAEQFIQAHPGQIGLITVSIGGNDVTSCASNADPITCVATAASNITTNVTQLASDLRAAAGPTPPLVGLTYPDVILGQWVHPPVNQTLAQESVVAFQSLINPALQRAYAGAGGLFEDVTAATGAYTPLTKLKNLQPYGKIPFAVAEVCKYSYYCDQGNIHATTKGYRVIAKLIVASLPHA